MFTSPTNSEKESRFKIDEIDFRSEFMNSVSKLEFQKNIDYTREESGGVHCPLLSFPLDI